MISNIRADVIDLFAGTGGLSLGYSSAYCNIVSAIEVDSDASKTYQLNLESITPIDEEFG